MIRKVSEPYGALGNMSRHAVAFQGCLWPRAEHLFQALRFAAGDPLRESIRVEPNPMRAKFLAKGASDRMVVEQLSEADVDNMRMVLRLKVEQHEEVRACLLSTGSDQIVEDCTRRPRGSGLFWGAALRDGEWVGSNWLGRLWMDLRVEIQGRGVLVG